MIDWWWRRKARCLVKRRYNIVNDRKPFGLNGKRARCWMPAADCNEGVHWDKRNNTNWSGPRV